MYLNLDPVQIGVLIVVAMEECDQTKVFLLYNKLALNVQEVEKKLLIHVQIVMAKETIKLLKKYL